VTVTVAGDTLPEEQPFSVSVVAWSTLLREGDEKNEHVKGIVPPTICYHLLTLILYVSFF